MCRRLVVLVLAACALGACLASGAQAAITGVALSAPSLGGSATENATYNGFSDSFTDTNLSDTASDFTAVIQWGDGVSDTGVITGGGGSFTISGFSGHTWADEGNFTVTVTLTKISGGQTATSSGTKTVDGEADFLLPGASGTVAAVENTTFSGQVGAFVDTYDNTASDFTATINWGDGAVSAGTVAHGGVAGAYDVSGSHAYAQDGTYTIQVSVSDDSPGTASTTTSATGHVIEGDELVGVVDPISPVEGAGFSGPVAKFRDALTTTHASALHATINWGDGKASAGTIMGANGSFSVSGNHAYRDEGSFPVSVTLAGNAPNLASASDSRVELVADARLAGSSKKVAARRHHRFKGVVGSFRDADLLALASDFRATINWGDRHTSAGTVTASGGKFAVSAVHKYSRAGSHLITIVVRDAGGTSVTIVSSYHTKRGR